MPSRSAIARVNIWAEPSPSRRPLQAQGEQHAVVADLRALVRQRSRGEIVSFIEPTKPAAINTPARRHIGPSVDPIPRRARVPETCLVFFPRAIAALELQFLLLFCRYARTASLTPASTASPAACPGKVSLPASSVPPGRHERCPARTLLRPDSTARTVHVLCLTIPIHMLRDGCFISKFCLRCLCLPEGAVIIYKL